MPLGNDAQDHDTNIEVARLADNGATSSTGGRMVCFITVPHPTPSDTKTNANGGRHLLGALGNLDTMVSTTVCGLSGAANSSYVAFARVPVGLVLLENISIYTKLLSTGSGDARERVRLPLLHGKKPTTFLGVLSGKSVIGSKSPHQKKLLYYVLLTQVYVTLVAGVGDKAVTSGHVDSDAIARAEKDMEDRTGETDSKEDEDDNTNDVDSNTTPDPVTE
ncbi:hypothetical protein DFS33DRAFT_1487667 [Desarmillaria ectypa]|nr:hypothetical protein DFS33DRAFT_1487667 [Desarmillaria ectypa]